MISSTGHFDGAIRYLTEKARTTYYMLRNSSLKYNHPIKHCLHIFDSLLKPILFYRSEVCFPVFDEFKGRGRGREGDLHQMAALQAMGKQESSLE